MSKSNSSNIHLFKPAPAGTDSRSTSNLRIDSVKYFLNNIFNNLLAEIFKYDTQEEYDKKYKPTIDKIQEEISNINLVLDPNNYQAKIKTILDKYPKKYQRLYSIITSMAAIQGS